MLGEEYNACSSALCNFLHSPVISSLLAPNIYLSTLFSNTLNLCSSLYVRDHVSQPSNTIGNIIVLYALTLNFFDGRWDDKITIIAWGDWFSRSTIVRRILHSLYLCLHSLRILHYSNTRILERHALPNCFSNLWRFSDDWTPPAVRNLIIMRCSTLTTLSVHPSLF